VGPLNGVRKGNFSADDLGFANGRESDNETDGVCVCLSHSGIVSKRLNVGSRK